MTHYLLNWYRKNRTEIILGLKIWGWSAVIPILVVGSVIFRWYFIENESPTEPNLKVAFIGDTGKGENFIKVLELIRDEDADMILHQGDFAYDESNPNAPQEWNDAIDSVLGPDFPYFGSIGGHDVKQWDDYKRILSARIPKRTCKGDLGVKMACHYRGLFFLLLGPGIMGADHTSYIQKQLKRNGSIWSICSWYGNQTAMQLGTKPDIVGWGPYEECRRGGAIIATAAEHSYHRTKTLMSMEHQFVNPLWQQPNKLKVGLGSSFVFVSGLGGRDIRDQERCQPFKYPYGCKGEWASVYTLDQGATYGALFIEFHVGDDPRKAKGYFKNIKGEIIDEFTIEKS